MIVFQWLKDWFEKNDQMLSERNITFSFSLLTETDNPAQYVDIDTESRMARVTLWETGGCDFQILENVTGKTVFWENGNIESEKDLTTFLNKGFSQL